MSMIETTKTHNDLVTIVTLDNVARHNTLTRDFWPNFRQLLDQLERENVRSVVLTGAGDRAFSAGGDLDSFRELTDFGERYAYMADCIRTFEAMERSDLFIISAVNGLAMGGGCELCFASDMVIASEHAEFSLPEAGFGLMPGYGAFRGASILGRQLVKYLITTGQRISADTAFGNGLVLEVVNQEECFERAVEIACLVADKPPLAVKACKRIVNGSADRQAFNHAIDLVTMLQGTDDVTEGINAFLEERKADFKGR